MRMFKIDYIDNLNEYMLLLTDEKSNGMVQQVKDLRYHICTHFNSWDYSISNDIHSFARCLETEDAWVEDYLRRYTDHFHVNRFKDKLVAEKVCDELNSMLVAKKLLEK